MKKGIAMKTKNNFWSLMTMMAVALATTFTMTACGDDDDDEQGGSTDQGLVGNWIITGDQDGDWDDDVQMIWNFYKDGTGEFSSRYQVDDNYTLLPVLGDISPYIADGWLYLTSVWNWNQTDNKVELTYQKLRIWKDGTYQKVVKEVNTNITDGNINKDTYQYEFLGNDRLKLTKLSRTGEVSDDYYMLKRKK